MPSKINFLAWPDSLQAEWFKLNAIIDEIAVCVRDGQWETLPMLLTARQQHLEDLFAIYQAPQQRSYLKMLADVIIEQDISFVAVIQAQQKLLGQQIGRVDKGRHAVQAYHNV
jgi:hypothetical protein